MAEWINGLRVERELVGSSVVLRVAEDGDAPGMCAAGDAEAFELMASRPDAWTDEGCLEHLRRMRAEGVYYSVFDRGTMELIGGTSYADVRTAHRGLEIGRTWLARSARGTRVNPEMKLLLLRQVFETPIFEAGPGVRVMLKTHHLNERSQRAIAGIGATLEGTMRNHMIMPDGSMRHTVMYSVTDGDWPLVRSGLQSRLARG